MFIGFEVMQLGVYHAVANFNIGGQASVNILSEVGMEPGEFCLDAFRKEDNLRVMKGNYKATNATKKRRKILRAQRKRRGWGVGGWVGVWGVGVGVGVGVWGVFLKTFGRGAWTAS